MDYEAARDMLNTEAHRIAARDGRTPRTYTLDDAALVVRTGRALLTIVRTSTTDAPPSDATPDPTRRTHRRGPAGDRDAR